MSKQTPTIAITCAYDEETNRAMLHMGYANCIINSGGLPFFILGNNKKQKFPQFDGVVLSGGGDIVPMLFGEKPKEGLGHTQYERDIFELNLVDYCLETKTPILGICRGMQVINVALNGTVIQDIGKDALYHNLKLSQRHDITICHDSVLFGLSGDSTQCVNSLHHQCVGLLGNTLFPTATSDEGYVEAIESYRHKILGVQWHPEKQNCPFSRNIFDYFISICS